MKWVSILGTLVLACLGAGCDDSECTNSFDCQTTPERSDPTNPYVCQENRCVPLLSTRPPSRDAGTDGGTENPTDGGTDGGVITCDTTPHDPKLGTLQLQAGFEATESAPLPVGILAVTAVGPGPVYALYGVRANDDSLESLGSWPSLQPATEALFPILAPEDRSSNVFLGSYLVNDGTRLLAGYTKSGTGFPGNVALYDTVTPAKSGYYAAPGNFSAVALPGYFLVNGLGLAGTTGDSGIYALKVESDPATSWLLATFDPSWSASSGLSAMTEDGVAVLGYFDGNTFINRLRAAPPSLYKPALQGGTAFQLAQASEIDVQSDLFSASSFGKGVALLRGNYDATFTPVYLDVTRVPLTISDENDPDVSVETPTPVLRFADKCTVVDLLAPLGNDLLVGMTDKNGRRLVRIHQP